MARVKLGEIYKVSSGGTPSKGHSDYYEQGTIKWVKTGDLKERYLFDCEDCITENGLNNSSARMYKPGTVLLAMYGATIGATSILKIDACTNQACAAFCPNDKIIPEYLYYFFKSKKEKFVKDGIGGAQPNISAGYLRNVEIELIDILEQQRIINLFEKIEKLIDIRKKQLEKLDTLIKTRFVEMFGNLKINNLGFPIKPMTDVCEIIDGDRGKNYPAQDEFSDEGYCLFLNAKNVTAEGFSFETCTFITKEKDEMLRKGHLNRGDVVLTTRGTIGNLAFYDNSVPFENVRINSGMVILRMNHDVILERFFIEQFKMQLALIKEKIASGSAQPQLPISTMNKINILIPEIKMQEQFVNFVVQVDKSKLAIQKSLEEAQLLFDSLMQQYFG